MTDMEEAYRLYFNDVYRYILSVSKNETVAEDITAETFLKAIQSVKSYRGECEIKVWLFRIAKNTYYSYLRKNSRLTTYEPKENTPSDENTEEAVIRKDTLDRIRTNLQTLEEPYKEVFSLRVFGEMSFKQIGEYFGKSENWACVTFHRAKGKLQDIF